MLEWLRRKAVKGEESFSYSGIVSFNRFGSSSFQFHLEIFPVFSSISIDLDLLVFSQLLHSPKQEHISGFHFHLSKYALHSPVSLLPVVAQPSQNVFVIKVFILTYYLFTALKDAHQCILVAQPFPFIRIHFKLTQSHLAVQLFRLQKLFWLYLLQSRWIEYLAFLIYKWKIIEVQHHYPSLV